MIQLDSVLLFVLVIPFIMLYRIGPSDTPYWFFGLIFLGLASYILLDILSLKEVLRFNLKKGLLWTIILLVIGSAFISAIIVRHQTAPIYMVHDIVIQQESAIRFLLHGKNPYSATYFGTPLEQWNYSPSEKNPALYHFVMEPFYLLFSLPFYFLSTRIFGFFDGRIPLLFLFFFLLVIVDRLIKNKEQKLLALTIFTFNPAILGYSLEGRSDIFMYAFLFFGFFLLHKKKYTWSAIFTSIAFSIKQSAWPLFPLYIAFLYFKEKDIKLVIKSLFSLLLVFLVISGPFIIWDYKAYVASTIFYLSGVTDHSYPISGYGFGMVLNSFGFIKDVHKYYPFQIWQILLGLPLLIFLLKKLKDNPTTKRLIFFYGVFLFIFWYFSRYFNNSHLGYISVVFMSAYFFPENTAS